VGWLNSVFVAVGISSIVLACTAVDANATQRVEFVCPVRRRVRV
jgi:hypothetical protein